MSSRRLLKIIGEIDDNYIEEAEFKENETKKYIWAKPLALAISFCLAIVLFSNLMDVFNSNTPNVNDSKSKIFTNQVNEMIFLDLDVEITSYYDQDNNKQKEMIDRFQSMMNLDFNAFVNRLSEQYSINSIYTLSSKGDESSIYKVHDFVFEFFDQSENRYQISMCPSEEPLRDCFINVKCPKESIILNTDVIIFQSNEMFIAQFKHNGIWYDVETNGVEIKELELFINEYILK